MTLDHQYEIALIEVSRWQRTAMEAIYMPKAHFDHDCSRCVYHGHMQGYDVYECKTSIVLRYGHQGPEYLSLPKTVAVRVAAEPNGQIWADAFEIINANG